MSHLSNYLKNFSKRYPKLRHKVLAKHLGIVPSHCSQICRGTRKSFNMVTVAKMTRNISEKPAEQAAFVRAYLMDQCPEEARKLVNISYRSPKAEIQEQGSALDHDAFTKFADRLREMALDVDVLSTLQKLAEIVNVNTG